MQSRRWPSKAWLASAFAVSLTVGVVVGTGVGTVEAAWRLAVREDFTTGTALRAELLLAAVDFAASLVGLIVAGGVAVATFLTVREMRSSRLQAAEIEAEKAGAALQADIRDQGWFVVAEFHSALAGMQGVTAMAGRASVLGRVRPSVEAPLMAETFAAHKGAARAIVSAQRLADTPGPWQRPAAELSDLMLEAMGAITDAPRLMEIAGRAAGPLKALQEALPRVSLGETAAAE